MFRNVVISILLVSLTVILFGCGSNKGTASPSGILAEINGEKITVKDVSSNPSFQQILQQLIYEKVIRQEFAARNLKIDDSQLKKEWDNVVKQSGGDEATAVESLKKQGVTKEFVLASLTTKLMLQNIIFQDKPVTMDDARKEFESNLEANQKAYAMNIPEKKDKPETVTFEDVADQVIENLKMRKFSQEAQATVDTLYNKYVENGWIINYIKPAEKKDLTKIEKPEGETTKIDPRRMRKAPVRSNDEKKDEGDSSSSGENK